MVGGRAESRGREGNHGEIEGKGGGEGEEERGGGREAVSRAGLVGNCCSPGGWCLRPPLPAGLPSRAAVRPGLNARNPWSLLQHPLCRWNGGDEQDPRGKTRKGSATVRGSPLFC